MKKEIFKVSAIPKASSGRKATTAYPFESMEVNDAFCAGSYSKELLHDVNGLSHYYAKKLGFKFAMRKVGDKLNVYRVS